MNPLAPFMARRQRCVDNPRGADHIIHPHLVDEVRANPRAHGIDPAADRVWYCTRSSGQLVRLHLENRRP